jgi:dGTPase
MPAQSLNPAASIATDAALSRGRLIAEPACPMRTPFQRDRDRIVHATAFRRLTYKTQVFLFHEGDHYRTRLTHTLEVAQIARAIARMLQLDEDLAEALALAHDLGHPPFGHAGERALDAVLVDFGGFDHNAQSLKVVTRLERKYMRFDGLNLSFETLEGLAKHNGPVGDGPVMTVLARAGLTPHLRLATQASLEAQAAAIADDIAYNNHDIDDGLRAGLLVLEDLTTVPLVGGFVVAALAADAPDRQRVIYEVNRRMITAMIENVVGQARLTLAAGADVDVTPVVTFSPGMSQDLLGLKQTLFAKVYRHPRVMHVMAGAEQIVRDVFQHYLEQPSSLPAPRNDQAIGLGLDARAALVSDFVAGMTDRYAIAEHRRLFDATPELR